MLQFNLQTSTAPSLTMLGILLAPIIRAWFALNFERAVSRSVLQPTFAEYTAGRTATLMKRNMCKCACTEITHWWFMDRQIWSAGALLGRNRTDAQSPASAGGDVIVPGRLSIF